MRGRQPAAGRNSGDVAEVHVTEALNAAHSEATHDGPVRKPDMSPDHRIVCGLAAGRAGAR